MSGPDGLEVPALPALAAAVQEVVAREAVRRQVVVPKTVTRLGYDVLRDMHLVRVDVLLADRGLHVHDRFEEALHLLPLEAAMERLRPALGELCEALWPAAVGGGT